MSGLASSGQLRMAYARRALFTVPTVVLLGLLSGALSNSGESNRWYALLDKPWFQPPGWVFPVAWTGLYIMLGFAAALILNARGSRYRGTALALFVMSFALNLCWSPLFFGMHKITAALLLIIAMFGVALATTVIFGRVRTTAAWLMVPYLAWLCFAAVLNRETIRLNPGAEALVVEATGTQIDIRH